jgi:heme exporter protein D
MSDFLSMGGYGFFVWGAYAVTFALIALESVLLVNRDRKAEEKRETQA